jgi:hypothetical protein
MTERELVALNRVLTLASQTPGYEREVEVLAYRLWGREPDEGPATFTFPKEQTVSDVLENNRRLEEEIVRLREVYVARSKDYAIQTDQVRQCEEQVTRLIEEKEYYLNEALRLEEQLERARDN